MIDGSVGSGSSISSSSRDESQILRMPKNLRKKYGRESFSGRGEIDDSGKRLSVEIIQSEEEDEEKSTILHHSLEDAEFQIVIADFECKNKKEGM